jgi:hypothetical protein
MILFAPYWLSRTSEHRSADLSRLRHGALFQFYESFTRQVTAFLNSDSQVAPY